jgi:hypothetical protein
MSEKYRFWKRIIFWENLKKTIAIFSAPGMLTLHELSAADHWLFIAGSFSFLGAILSVWIADHNNNGIVDLFEHHEPPK